jgi:hypothetical protein
MKKIFVFNFLLLAFGSVVANPSVEESRNVMPFTKINFEIAANIVLVQGPDQAVHIQGKTDAVQNIETEVRDGVLVIGNKRKIRWPTWSGASEPVDIFVTANRIEGITVSGAGTLRAPNALEVGNARLLVSGSGSLQAELIATGQVNADVSGSGTIDLKGKFKSVKSRISGSGNVSLSADVAGNTDLVIIGSGTVTATGASDSLNADVSGSGKILARMLEAKTSVVRISGAGDVEINVKSDLDAAISGSGNIYYKGNPVHLSSRSSGSGTIKTFQ